MTVAVVVDGGRRRYSGPPPATARVQLEACPPGPARATATTKAPESRCVAASQGGEKKGWLSEDLPGWDENARARRSDRALIAPISTSLENHRDQRTSGPKKRQSRDLL